MLLARRVLACVQLVPDHHVSPLPGLEGSEARQLAVRCPLIVLFCVSESTMPLEVPVPPDEAVTSKPSPLLPEPEPLAPVM